MAPWIPIGSLRSQFQAALLTSWVGMATQALPVVPAEPVVLPPPVVPAEPVVLPPPVVPAEPVVLPPPVPVAFWVCGEAQPNTSSEPRHAPRREGAYERIRSSEAKSPLRVPHVHDRSFVGRDAFHIRTCKAAGRISKVAGRNPGVSPSSSSGMRAPAS